MKFERAETAEEKKRILSDIKYLLLSMYGTFLSAEEMSSFYKDDFKNHPEFLNHLNKELDFLHKIEKKPELKLMQVKKLIAEKNFLRLAKIWLSDLKILDNAEAYYLFAHHFEDNPLLKSGHIRNAAWGGYIPAQLEHAQYHAKSEERVDHRIAYYWFMNLKKIGVDVNYDLQNLRSRMNEEDIAIVNSDLDNEDSVFR